MIETSTPIEPYPTITIRFPISSEADLIAAFKHLPVSPWRWDENAPDGTPWVNWEVGYLSFRRAAGDGPSCWLYVWRRKQEECRPGEGEFYGPNLIRDLEIEERTPRDEFARILQEFDRLIATPAAAAVGGTTTTIEGLEPGEKAS